MREDYSSPNYYPEVRFPTTISPAQVERERQARQDATRRAIEARQQRETKLAADREKAAQEQAAEALEAYKTERRRQWVAVTGSDAGFDAAWPAMRERYATDQLDKVEQARAELRASGAYNPL